VDNFRQKRIQSQKARIGIYAGQSSAVPENFGNGLQLIIGTDSPCPNVFARIAVIRLKFPTARLVSMYPVRAASKTS
jgi:hypothetical protein